MTKRLRWIYGILFLALLLTEIYIGIFVRDRFVRPYLGDVLITMLLCCLFRTVFPAKVRALPIYVFLFSVFVEITQYLNLVKLLGLENNRLLSVLMGTSFSFIDLVCYAVGCVAFWGMEKAIRALLK